MGSVTANDQQCVTERGHDNCRCIYMVCVCACMWLKENNRGLIMEALPPPIQYSGRFIQSFMRIPDYLNAFMHMHVCLALI